MTIRLSGSRQSSFGTAQGVRWIVHLHLSHANHYVRRYTQIELVPRLQDQPVSALRSDFRLEAKSLAELQKTFVFSPDSSVSNFLSEHPELTQILLEASAHLREHFGAATVLNLRAPIDESGSQTLYAVAMWPGSVGHVRRALAKFDDSWWIAHSRSASGHLAFTYELV